ncbi:hypothetical protein HYU11_02655 [Candidatus Woesearchaeota archaeon]|nr:hypothetical protein [Candidatus Woesearchaeota archaeon]
MGVKNGGKPKPKAKHKSDKKIQAPELSKDVQPEFYFWLSDGRVIKNAAELAEAAKCMSDEIFSYHTNPRKNDFADWIRDIVKNEDLAFQVRKAKNRKELEEAIRKSGAKKTHAPVEPEPKKEQVEESNIEKIIKTKQTEKPIQKTQHEKTESQASTIESLRKREEELIKAETRLSEEEQKLYQLKIELTKKRFEVLKKRGELEKEMFEHFMETKAEKISEETKPTLNNRIVQDIGKERIESLLSEAKETMAQGRIDEATRKYLQASDMFSRSPIRPDEKNALRFKIMELEADIKLAGLKKIA